MSDKSPKSSADCVKQRSVLRMGFSCALLGDDLLHYRQHIEQLEDAVNCLINEIPANAYVDLRRVLDVLGERWLRTDTALSEADEYELRRLLVRCNLHQVAANALVEADVLQHWYRAGWIVGYYASLYCMKHGVEKGSRLRYVPDLRGIEEIILSVPGTFAEQSSTFRMLVSRRPKGPSLDELIGPFLERLPGQSRAHWRRSAVKQPSTFLWQILDQVAIELTALVQDVSCRDGPLAIRDGDAGTERSGKCPLKWDNISGRLFLHGECIKEFDNPAASQRAILDAFTASISC